MKPWMTTACIGLLAAGLMVGGTPLVSRAVDSNDIWDECVGTLCGGAGHPEASVAAVRQAVP